MHVKTVRGQGIVLTDTGVVEIVCVIHDKSRGALWQVETTGAIGGVQCVARGGAATVI